jgi:hypothetical protein
MNHLRFGDVLEANMAGEMVKVMYVHGEVNGSAIAAAVQVLSSNHWLWSVGSVRHIGYHTLPRFKLIRAWHE